MTIKTPTQILAEINGEIVPGVAGGITAPTVNEILADIVNSFQPIGQANLINADLTPGQGAALRDAATLSANIQLIAEL